ncbi:MAG: ribbon-helix-helix protein, CopG family [Dehalococcoidia bacterium]|nr:ribbon-helix-helix protein, CopG family [Dehalococcoidia bacterium]
MEDRKESVRVSATVPVSDHTELERIAQAKRVSFAWVVRDAIAQYLAAQEPLFRRGHQ